MAQFADFGNSQTWNWEKKEHAPIVEYVTTGSGWNWDGFVYECELVFILEGAVAISNGYEKQALIESMNGILLMPGNAYKALFKKATTMIRFRMNGDFPLREYFRADKVELLNVKYSQKVKTLRINDKLGSFLNSLNEEYQRDAVDSLLAEIKRKELFHILNKYYERDQVLSFLYPLFSENYTFMSFVYNNYRKVRSVNEFAYLANSCMTTFCERFKAVFGVSAYRWMMEKRNELILNELMTTKKQMKQIADELGFSSSSQFCDYCKKHLGKTPNKIRKNGFEENKILLDTDDDGNWSEKVII